MGAEGSSDGGAPTRVRRAETQALRRADSRKESVRRHQEILLEEIRKEGDASLEGKLPINDSVGRTLREGEYKVEQSATHVTRIADGKPGEPPWKKQLKDLVSGGGSGAITKTATAPLERVKILLQVQGMKMVGVDKSQYKYRGVWGTLRTVVREEGFLALYAGNFANVIRVIPVYALKFSFNETFKDMVRTPGQDLDFMQLIAAGTLAGLFQTICTYPLETVRTRLTLGSLGVQYSGIWDVLRRTVRTEGVGGLYKGIMPTFLSGSPYVGLQMTFYEVIKRDLERRNAANKSVLQKQVEKLFAGAAAGVIAQTVTYPGDTVRRRMQMNGMNGEPKLYTNSWDCTTKLVRTEGVRGLFNGLGANTIRALPGAAIQFWAFDFLNDLCRSW